MRGGALSSGISAVASWRLWARTAHRQPVLGPSRDPLLEIACLHPGTPQSRCRVLTHLMAVDAVDDDRASRGQLRAPGTGDEHVADPAHCLDRHGIGGIDLDLRSQPGDAQVDGAIERVGLATRHDLQAGDCKHGDSGTDGSQTLPWRERIRTIGTAGEGPDASCVGSLSLRLFG